MGNNIYIFLVVVISLSCKQSANQDKKLVNNNIKIQKIACASLDSTKVSKSQAVIKGRLIKFEGGDKYYYSSFKVLEVLLNKSNYHFKDTIRVAHYNWNKGIPKNKDCTIYITPWPLSSTSLNEKEEWMLIEGDGEYACE